MRDVSHPAAPTVKNVPIDASEHARVNQFVNGRKVVVSEMFYNYLRHYMSSGVHHPAVAKHGYVQRRVQSAALKHTLKGVFRKAKFESTQTQRHYVCGYTLLRRLADCVRLPFFTPRASAMLRLV